MRLRTARTDELDERTLEAIRVLLVAAFKEGFPEADWNHALGGVHLFLEDGEHIVSHASVVPRELETRERRWRTGFVEAVATRPDAQGRGHGTTVMRAAGDHIRTSYELGSLSTGEHAFYERLGWRRWRGTTGVRMDDGPTLTPLEDDGVMVLLTEASATIDVTGLITCEWRPGDVW